MKLGPGLVAVILAGLAGGAILALAIGSLVVRSISLDPSEAELLGTVIGAAIGAVATYLGTSVQRNHQDDEKFPHG